MTVQFASLLPGDPAPWFRQRCTTAHGTYTFDMSAGRHVVLFFFDSSLAPQTASDLQAVRAAADLFDGRRASFFGVSADPADEAEGRLREEPPAIRFFFDADATAGRLYGARPASADGAARGRSLWVVLDPMLRVLGVLDQAPGTAGLVLAALRGRLAQPATPEPTAPVLLLDQVFEPEFCRRLIDYYHRAGNTDSGVFTEREVGRSEAVSDPGFKRRRDCLLRDRTLVEQVQARLIRRVVPEIRKAFQFEASRLERLVVACYDVADGGRFGPHRDNTVQAAAHRRFAVSINLNNEFEGGGLSFPEFGPRLYRPPAGGAAIFSCSLMHAVAPVTAGRRFACLPFIYDEAALKVKRANLDIIRNAMGAGGKDP